MQARTCLDNEDGSGIMQQGFDERLSRRGLHGKEVYFTTAACKAIQYNGKDRQRYIILTRALLGHPYKAQSDMRDAKRPPDVEANVPEIAVENFSFSLESLMLPSDRQPS